MSMRSAERQFAVDWIEENRARLSEFDLEIWRYAEPAWREYRSARAYRELLRAEGFDVEEASGGMPTAFVATWGDGKPVLGAYAEYDAVPGNSQQAVPYPAPREGLHPWAAGHTDPHSMLGVAGLTGILAAKAAMERHGIKGTLCFYGEPAEKVCGSKPIHAAKGYYDGVDAFVAYHPHARNTVVWDTHCGSYWSAVFTFQCREPERWLQRDLPAATQTSHATARCPGAIDALCLMYTTTKLTKEAMFPHTGTWTLNELILAGGDATADNLPPRFSQIQYAWRSPDLAIQERIFAVLANNARQAAAATGCEASVRWVSKTRVGLPNRALADLTWRNLQLVGPPRYSETAKEFGRAIQRNLGLEPADNPFLPVHEELLDPRAYEAQLRDLLPAWQTSFTSDDYVEYTWHAPAVRLLTARPILRPLQGSTERRTYPAWTYNALGGVPDVIDPGLFVAGQTIALTLLDLLASPDELARCQAEFLDRTGGIGGAHWVAPLLPKDVAPPIDLPWPEYVSTCRGEEWCFPTPTAGFGESLA
jgi:aminobenzoyl-glutamate utilization protein B